MWFGATSITRISTCALVVSTVMVSSGLMAQTIRFGGVIPGGPMVTKQITSHNEAKYRNLVRQRFDFSCGAAALATVLKFAYNLEVDEQIVLSGLMKVSDQVAVSQRGFSLLDLKRYVETLGFTGRGYRIEKDRLRDLRIPSIVLLDIRGYKHFVVLKRVDGDYAYVADPALGNKTMPIEEFVAAWPSKTLFTVIGKTFNRASELLNVSRPKVASDWRASHDPRANRVETIDFGINHLDLF